MRLREVRYRQRRDIYEQIVWKMMRIEPPNDYSTVAYTKLLMEEDPTFIEMFGEMIEWVNVLPQEDVGGDD